MGLINKEIGKLRRKHQRRKLANTEIYKEYGAVRDSLGLRLDFGDISPMGRTCALAVAMADGHGCRTILKAAEKLNTTRAAHGSLQSVAPGFRIFGQFCAVIGRAPSLPSEDMVNAWSCIFRPCRTNETTSCALSKASPP